MLTTCSECRTVFRVSQEQLDGKRGLVRCGHCQAVFNAYDALLPELTNLPREAAEPAVPETGDAPLDMALYTDDMLAMPPAVKSDQPYMAPALSVPEELPDEAPDEAPAAWSDAPSMLDLGLPPTAIPEAEGPEQAPEAMSFQHVEGGTGWEAEPATPAPAAAETADTPAAPAPAPDDILLTPLATARPAATAAWLPRLAWGGAALVLVLLLVLQVAYFLRDDLAAAVPELRPTLQRACDRLGCALTLARDLTALRIESSSLESDPEDKSRASLNLSLSNRARQPVAWPHLVLVLTDTRDLPVAQRPFAPSEYLPRGAATRPGLAPGQEQEVRLELELKGLAAYGYKLELAYP